MVFASSVVLALAVASVSAHSIHHVRRHHAPRAQPPAGWATNYLEDYDTYHTRYLAIGCEDKHDTTFFDMCCHPMLATETLEKNRAPCCAPGSTAQCPSSSSSAAIPASTSTDDDCDDDGDDGGDGDDDEDCDDEGDGEDASSTVASVKPLSSTPADNDEDCDDDGDGEDASPSSTPADNDDDDDCEEDSDDDSAATSTHVVSASTHSSSEAAPTTAPATHKTVTTVKASTTSTADESAKTASSSSSFPLVTGGFATWFTQNGVAGACGTVHQDTDFVVALPTVAYEKGANCGRKIRVFKADDDDTYVDAVVADECPTCTNKNCVDMSVATFKKLATLSTGEFSVKYQFLN